MTANREEDLCRFAWIRGSRGQLMKTLITNGRIVTAVDDYVADVLVEGETITLIGRNLARLVGEVDKTIDATDKLVIPGGIDRSEERRVGKECRSRWSSNH